MVIFVIKVKCHSRAGIEGGDCTKSAFGTNVVIANKSRCMEDVLKYDETGKIITGVKDSYLVWGQRGQRGQRFLTHFVNTLERIKGQTCPLTQRWTD